MNGLVEDDKLKKLAVEEQAEGRGKVGTSVQASEECFGVTFRKRH